jgi:hypothetical protein
MHYICFCHEFEHDSAKSDKECQRPGGREAAAGWRGEWHDFVLLAQLVAVGTVLADGPPHRSQRAGFPHWAPVMGTWRRTALRAKGA